MKKANGFMEIANPSSIIANSSFGFDRHFDGK